MPRIRLTIEYDGTAYAGWQRQVNALAVQQVVEECVARCTGAQVTLIGASRTDAGVHALGQVAAFDTQSRIPPGKFAFALNTMLPPDIRILDSTQIDPAFHPRFAARGKLYRYRVHAAPHASALMRNQCAHVIYPLHLQRMQEEAEAILGTHDFSAFAASGSVVKDTVRTMRAVSVSQSGSEFTFQIYGTGFLYNMVRIFAGTLIGVGAGKIAPGAIARALQTGDRLSLGVTAPAHGLTLMRVDYTDLPDDCLLSTLTQSTIAAHDRNVV